MTRRHRPDERAVSTVIGAILVVAILAIAAVTFQTRYVPIQDKRKEADHAHLVQAQLAALRAEIDRQVVDPTDLVVSNPISLGGAGTTAFGITKPGDSVSFRPATNTLTVASTRLNIQVNNGQVSTGANETWTPVTSSGQSITDVANIQSFRLRLPSISRDNDTQSLTITVKDAAGTFAGDFRVSVQNVGGADFYVYYRVRNRDAIEIYNNPDGFHNNAFLSPFWIDLFDPRYSFDDIVAATTTPLSIELTKPSPPGGLGGDFSITYLQQQGGLLVGAGGQTIPNYVRTFPSGTLTYAANNIRWPQQTYRLENGGLVLTQPEGSVFRVAPSFTARGVSGTASPTLQLPKPSGTAEGHFLLAQVTVAGGSGTSVTAPAGWTLLRRDDAGTTLGQAVYYRFAQTGEPVSYTWTLSQTVRAAGTILAYGGIDPSNPVDAQAGQANADSTTLTAPSATTTASNDLVVRVFGTAAQTTLTPPSGTTERSDTTLTGTPTVTAGTADHNQASPGATGTATATAGATAANIGQTVALRTLGLSFQDVQSADSGSGSGLSLSITRPASTVGGHLLLAHVVVGGGTGQTITPPAGWSLVRRDNSGTALAAASYQKFATSSEPASYSWSFSSSAKNAGGITVYAQVDRNQPVDVHDGKVNPSSTSVVAPSVTTLSANARLVGLFATHSQSTYTPPASMTERYDVRATGANAVAASGAGETVPNPGATGTRTATTSQPGVNIGQSVALRPALRFQGATTGTSDAGTATQITLSIPILDGIAADFQGDRTVTVRTSARPGTDIQGAGPDVTLTLTTPDPALWARFFREEFNLVPGFMEGTQFTVTQTSTQVTLTVVGRSTSSTTDDVVLILRQATINLDLRS